MNILIIFHTPVNAGYAMKTLEKTFYEVSLSITNSPENIYFAFNEYEHEMVQSLPTEYKNIFEINRKKLLTDNYYKSLKKKISYIKFDLAICFDLQVSGHLVNLLRESNVEKIVSYWGSTISGYNQGLKLLAKKIEVKLSRKKPDLFIFESESMRHYATHGRGISKTITCVIPTGVDTKTFSPINEKKNKINELFPETTGKKIAIYSGHMEERKGVRVLIEAMKSLVDIHNNFDWHLLVCGNRPGEQDQFLKLIKNHLAKDSVTFCGYRDDLELIMPACDIGLIASTGWDSFPMSALEMAACGLPIIVSNLQGLAETVEDGVTGYLFEPGNYTALANILNRLTQNPKYIKIMSENARERVLNHYSLEIQKRALKTKLVDIFTSN